MAEVRKVSMDRRRRAQLSAPYREASSASRAPARVVRFCRCPACEVAANHDGSCRRFGWPNCRKGHGSAKRDGKVCVVVKEANARCLAARGPLAIQIDAPVNRGC